MPEYTSERAIRQSGRVGRYLWVLSEFAQEGRHLTTSKEVSEASGINATQVRRDLSCLLGRSGKRGVGYNVRGTLEALRSRTTVTVEGDGPVASAVGGNHAAATLALLGLTTPAEDEWPDVAVIDYLFPTPGREAAEALAHAGVSLIVNYGPYLVEAPPARVVHVAPILALAEAIA